MERDDKSAAATRHGSCDGTDVIGGRGSLLTIGELCFSTIVSFPCISLRDLSRLAQTCRQLRLLVMNLPMNLARKPIFYPLPSTHINTKPRGMKEKVKEKEKDNRDARTSHQTQVRKEGIADDRSVLLASSPRHVRDADNPSKAHDDPCPLSQPAPVPPHIVASVNEGSHGVATTVTVSDGISSCNSKPFHVGHVDDWRMAVRSKGHELARRRQRRNGLGSRKVKNHWAQRGPHRERRVPSRTWGHKTGLSGPQPRRNVRGADGGSDDDNSSEDGDSDEAPFGPAFQFCTRHPAPALPRRLAVPSFAHQLIGVETPRMHPTRTGEDSGNDSMGTSKGVSNSEGGSDESPQGPVNVIPTEPTCDDVSTSWTLADVWHWCKQGAVFGFASATELEGVPLEVCRWLRLKWVGDAKLKSLSGISRIHLIHTFYAQNMHHLEDVSALDCDGQSPVCVRLWSAHALSNLAPLHRVQSLSLRACPLIRNTSALAHAKVLDLRDCAAVEDVSALGGVHTLDISYSNVADVTALQGVHSLDVSYTPLTSLLPVFSNIHTLTLAKCTTLVDVGPLARAHTLSITSCQGVTDVSALGGVHTLTLARLSVRDVSALGGVHTLSLTYLRQVSDVGALSHVHTLNLSTLPNVTCITALQHVHTLNVFSLRSIRSLGNLEATVHTLSVRSCPSILLSQKQELRRGERVSHVQNALVPMVRMGDESGFRAGRR